MNVALLGSEVDGGRGAAVGRVVEGVDAAPGPPLTVPETEPPANLNVSADVPAVEVGDPGEGDPVDVAASAPETVQVLAMFGRLEGVGARARRCTVVDAAWVRRGLTGRCPRGRR